MIKKMLAGVIAIIGAAALTLGAILALVQITIYVAAIPNLPLRFLAVACDIVAGTVTLIVCVFLATHLAVRILGVGESALPPFPEGQ